MTHCSNAGLRRGVCKNRGKHESSQSHPGQAVQSRSMEEHRNQTGEGLDTHHFAESKSYRQPWLASDPLECAIPKILADWNETAFAPREGATMAANGGKKVAAMPVELRGDAEPS